MREKYEIQFREELEKVNTINEINMLRSVWLGKSSPISEMMKDMASLDNEQRKALGQEANNLKQFFSKEIELKLNVIKEREVANQIANESLDVSLSTLRVNAGTKHPLTLVTEQAINFFSKIGYLNETGNEVESDLFNFEKLNMPKDHPARAMQDTFYIDENTLLRTHCTSVTARTIEKIKEAPIRVVAHGPVYRRDDDDATHSHQFSQIDGVNIDANISLANLKWTLLEFTKEMFGSESKIRMRPSFFPFTEPSFEVDVSCTRCGGKGCSICKDTGWIEILGAGMLHPNVIKMNGLDPKVYQGFAFGIGIERIAMLKYGIEDIRRFYTNDLRFLSQFKKV